MRDGPLILRPAVEGPAPRIGLVVPAYRQPKLLDEALASALAQRGARPPAIVVVNDGCPMPETDSALRAWAAARPDAVTALRRPNGGLSAARNAGVRYLLAERPSVEGIFMLDADNLLEPDALALFERLLDERPEIDWFYPQFDMFGLVASASNGGPFSTLMLSAENMCEAGSLVRRRVFEAGVRYDETMRLGYEDWDFWLSAVRAGFRGAPFSAPAFRYRKRPESMLSGAHRHDAELRGYLRRKHAWLYTARAATRLEQAEAPRYRIFFVDEDDVLATTDPLAPGRRIDVATFEEEVWRWIATPGEAEAGAIWVATSRAAWRTLAEAGLLRFALWDLERRLDGVNVATLLLDSGTDGALRIDAPDDATAPHRRAAFAAVGADLVRAELGDAGGTPLRRLLDLDSPARFSHRLLELATEAPPPGDGAILARLTGAVAALDRSRFRASAAIPADWRNIWLPPRHMTLEIARRAAGSGALYPAAPAADSPPRVCFLLTTVEFGGVEQVAANIAAAMRRRGLATALCMLGTRPLRIGCMTGVWDEILCFPDERLAAWSDQTYEGTWLPAALDAALARDVVGLLGGFDAVVACHAGGGMGALGALRRHGVVTVVHEHVIEAGAFGRSYGSPVVALAYEASADLIATCSEALADWMRAHGVPAEKVVAAPNAPSYPLDENARRRIAAAREAAPAERPLRALFLGRLDRQKGVDRLAAVIARLRGEGAPVTWRVVGKPVVEADVDGLRALADRVSVEPPAQGDAARTALYAWADVVVLPSRFEGLPLTVLEAQRCGAVPVAARAGALDEAVTDGADGFLVSQERCVEEMTAILARLASDRAELARVAAAAMRRERSWDATAGPLIDRIAAEIGKRRATARI